MITSNVFGVALRRNRLTFERDHDGGVCDSWDFKEIKQEVLEVRSHLSMTNVST